jgi:anti-sigma factor RsiW
MMKRDRFELLSAYLDGEVTASERVQVEDWLANDPEVQGLYKRLLKLRQGLRTLPVPTAEQPVEYTIQQVLGRLNRRPRLAVIWGGAAIAALFVGALSSGRQYIGPQIAQSPEPAAPVESLMVALNTPVVEIPKAAVEAPNKSVRQNGLPHQPSKDNVN